MVSYRSPFSEMESLRRSIERAFDDVGIGRWTYPFSRISFLPGRSARAYPLLNVGETQDEIVVEALAPGLDPDSLKVTVVNNQLTLAGEKRLTDEDIQPEAYHRSERSAGAFVRTIELPVPVDANAVSANYSKGLLRVTLPKAEEAKPKKIDIKVD